MDTSAEALDALDTLIQKGRVHMYKPIQIAEILHRARTDGLDLSEKENYRIKSRHWRDAVSERLVGRVSTSSVKYQDNVFDENAIPLSALQSLDKVNRASNGGVEAYIYARLGDRWQHLKNANEYISETPGDAFSPQEFMSHFDADDSALSGSTDKAFECLTTGMVSLLYSSAPLQRTLSLSTDVEVLPEVSEFIETTLGLSAATPTRTSTVEAYRVGVTNAADAGIDIHTTAGPFYQVKHETLTPADVESMVEDASYHSLLLICKRFNGEPSQFVTDSSSPVRGILTLDYLDQTFRGIAASDPLLAGAMVDTIESQFNSEFPHVIALTEFAAERGYDLDTSRPLRSDRD